MMIYNDTDPDNIEDVTIEIIEEVNEHQIFYAITDELSGFSISSASNDPIDSNGFPLLQKRPGQLEKPLEMLWVSFHEPTSKTAPQEMMVRLTLKLSLRYTLKNEFFKFFYKTI